MAEKNLEMYGQFLLMQKNLKIKELQQGNIKIGEKPERVIWNDRYCQMRELY